jgi:hypothetical protein
MSDLTGPRWDAARDAAQQAVTAAIHGDRDLASRIVTGFEGEPLALALTLVDLVAFVNYQWADSVGVNPAAGWQVLMAGVEATRSGEPS